MKILNLYCGIGGNRRLWGDEHEITAVEIKPQIAAEYQKLFPRDTVIVGDAHKYLLEHFEEFDFIWSSPPCPTHSKMNDVLHAQGVRRYPDMMLYQEIIYLKHRFKGKFVVENVMSYYDPLIIPQVLDRHYFWANFYIAPFDTERNFNWTNSRASTRLGDKEYDESLESYLGIHLAPEVKGKRLLLRNCVFPPLGKHILEWAQKETHKSLFDTRLTTKDS